MALPPGEHMNFGSNAGASVDAYLEYKRIVGDDDGGQMFTPEEYEDYKRRVVPQRMKNRVFVSWTSPSGMDCKLIGPETLCFCGHRYKQHITDLTSIPETRPILLPCKQRGCKCATYNYVPMNGGQQIRCRCKHFTDSHESRKPYVCKNSKAGCKCTGFYSSFSCSCGSYAYEHETLVQTKEERQAAGKPIGHDVGYQAMGGITGFSSLAEGYMRLDDSGVGAPSKEFLNMPVAASDHPFLRANLPSINRHRAFEDARHSVDELADEYRRMGIDPAAIEADRQAESSAARRPDEDDMEYFERRYQQRLRDEKTAKRIQPNPTRGRITGPTTSNGRGVPNKSARGGRRQL